MNDGTRTFLQETRDLLPGSRLRLLSLPRRRWASFSAAVIGGLAGSRDHAFRNHLPVMHWREDYQDVSASQLLFQKNKRRRGTVDVAIMVHGLMIDESCWKGAIHPFAATLETRLGWTPLYVRYNTGLHISTNGRLLADLLHELYLEWGDDLGRIHLIGHSMGGLVARSCLEWLRRDNHDVLNHVDRLILMCTPNGGVEVEQLRYGIENGLRLIGDLAPQLIETLMPQEKTNPRLREVALDTLVRTASSAAARIPKAAASAALWFVSFPSDGIRDVRFGYMQPEEWQAHRSDELAFMTNHRRPLPPPDHVRTYAIAASLWPTTTDVPSRVRNDGIVTVASVAAQTLDFDDIQVLANGRFKELPLLLHQVAPVSDRISDVLEAWVTREP